MMMQSGVDNATKMRIMQAQTLCKEARGVMCARTGLQLSRDDRNIRDTFAKSPYQYRNTLYFLDGAEHLNLGKKISIPKDVMMEELNLPNRNRGSRMFQERQKRVEKFTLENNASGAQNTFNIQSEASPPEQIPPQFQEKENQTFSIPGKHSLVMNLQKTVAKKGSPDVLAPGFSGPLKEIPHERFNTTVIPKSYCSPWREALGTSEELLNAHISQLPQDVQGLQPAHYRCFNRSAMPFGGMMANRRVIPVIGFEAVESQTLPGAALDRMCRRPNFNRAPRGWGINYFPESNEL